jgi:hypothetical protein
MLLEAEKVSSEADEMRFEAGKVLLKADKTSSKAA